MTEEQAAIELDEEILEAALTILDGGARPTLEELAPRFPGREAQIVATLDALRDYQRRVEANRDQGEAALAEGVLVPGTELGDFTLDWWLGGGGMGGVYRARQRSKGNREVALKVLSPALANKDPHALARFQRESNLASGVRHQSFAEVYATGTEQGYSYIAMRLIEGRTLHDVLLGLVLRRQLEQPGHENREYVRRVVRLVREVACSLGAIHAMGLVHRDVKPSNIILEGANEGNDLEALGRLPVLVDYGLLKPIESTDLTGDQTVLGTAAFVSPEAWLGREVDARSDVFSLGAVLHDLLSLTRPGKRRLAISGLSDVSVLNPAVDRRLAAIVGMALDDKVGVRYRDGRAFASDLDRYLQGKTVAALPANPLRRLVLRYRRNPVQTTTAVLLGLLLGLLLAGAGYVGKAARMHYDVAAAARQLDEAGAIPGAEATYATLRDSSLTRRLPGLDSAQARAEAYADESVSRVCAMLRGEEGAGLREAHVELQHLLLTPGAHEGWHPTWKRFLWKELGAESSYERRLRAAETTAYYHLVHPHPYGGAAGASPEDRQLEERLLEVARTTRGLPEELELHRLVLSALSGFPGEASLASFVGSMRDTDWETYRVAGQSAVRIWYRAREEGKLLELPPPLLAEWAGVAGERCVDLPQTRFRVGWGTSELICCSVAWTRLVRAEAGFDVAAVRGTLPEALGAYLDRLEEAFRKLREGEEVPRVAPLADYWSVFDRKDGPGRTAWCEKHILSEEDPYSTYENIWTLADPGLDGDLASDPGEPVITQRRNHRNYLENLATAMLSVAGPEPAVRLEGQATRVRWTGVEPTIEGPGRDQRYLLLSRPGRSRVSLASRVPARAGRARIVLEHCYAMRAFLPHGGSARIRVNVGSEGTTHELDVHLGQDRDILLVDSQLWGPAFPQGQLPPNRHADPGRFPR